MGSSIFAFATDLADEGLDAVLDNAGGRAGVDGLTLAVAYHAARDVFPHNPVRKVRYLEGGVVYFHPDPGPYEGLRLRPRVAEMARSRDPLGDLLEAAGARGMETNAWAVFLHNDRLGFEHPECATQNAFGDRYLTDLCPANPEVRAYCRALASDVARYGVSTLFAESLHYHGLGHGYHHERYFEALGDVGEYLLGLCFCEHCIEAARRNGVDAEKVQAFVRDELMRRFEGDPKDSDGLTRDLLEPYSDGQLLRYLDARTRTVTSLAEEVSSAAGETRVAFLDLSGAEKGFATGEPAGGPVAEIGWQNGVDAANLAGACDSVIVTGYAAGPDRLAFDLDAYATLVPDASRLGLLLRPMPPDCRSGENLRTKVGLARGRGIGQLGFYHYGFARLDALDRIKYALAAG